MWARRSYSDGVSMRCTVKFAGSIPQWPDTIALGLEWDEPSRGRNSGELEGIQYFRCTVPGAGSFVKSTRVCEDETTLGAAIFRKYIDNAEFQEIELDGGKVVETVGVDKLYERHARIEDLAVVAVEAARVKSLDVLPIGIDKLHRLERLDLSNNLIESFDHVLELASQLPRLAWLRLNGNRFQFRKAVSVPQLLTLELSNTLVTEDDIEVLSQCFANLEMLGLAQNRLTSIPQSLPPRLKTLDLSGNFIKDVAQTSLPSTLDAAFLSDNGITEVASDFGLPNEFSVRGSILDWGSISVIGSSRVSVLHVSHEEGEEAAQRAYVITRCPGVQWLNGTEVSTKERSDAELYTMNAVAKKAHPPLPDSLWESLLTRYGDLPSLPDRSIRARLITFYLGNSATPIRLLRDAPVSLLFRQIARATKGNVRDVRVKGLNETRELYKEDFSAGLTVQEVVSDGIRLELI